MLSNVLVSSSVSTNILSVRRLCAENNLAILFTTNSAFLYRYGGSATRAGSSVNELTNSVQSLPYQSNISMLPSESASPKDITTSKEIKISNNLTSHGNLSSSDLIPLFSLSRVQDLYSFKINIRSFADMSQYHKHLAYPSRDPRPCLVLNVIEPRRKIMS